MKLFKDVVNLLPPYLRETYKTKYVFGSSPPLIFSRFTSLLKFEASAFVQKNFRAGNIFGAIPNLDKALACL